MKTKSRSILILSVLFAYIFLQFLWWEVLLVKHTGQIIELKQKIAELTISDEAKLSEEIALLHKKKATQVIMVVGEGTIFLLLLLFGVYKIRQAHSKEVALNRQQQNFLLSITHELKTPIAATKLQLQTLQKQKLTEVTQQDLIANALEETERLNSLIDNVLLASHLDTDKFALKLERQNISELVAKIVSRYYQKEIHLKQLNLKIEQGILSNIDETYFTSIITNLIDNAIKYSPDNIQITIQLLKDRNTAVLTVKDNGIGISNLDKDKIFTKFYRAGSETTRNTKGTGLGLYIVKYLVEKHRAQIVVKDNQPKGSAFEIKFYAA